MTGSMGEWMVVAIEQLAGAVLVLLVGVAIGGWLQRDRTVTQAVEGRISRLAAQIEGWQRTHDVHQGELDRRLARVEEAAARAENETRMLAGLLADEVDDGERSRPRVLAHAVGHARRAG
jgi:hypothetical protein